MVISRTLQLKQLAQEESDAKCTDLVLSCETHKRVPSPFWQQVRRLRGNEQKEKKGVKDQNNKIQPEELQKEERLAFNRLNWRNSVIAPVTAEEVKARIGNLNLQVEVKSMHKSCNM